VLSSSSYRGPQPIGRLPRRIFGCGPRPFRNIRKIAPRAIGAVIVSRLSQLDERPSPDSAEQTVNDEASPRHGCYKPAKARRSARPSGQRTVERITNGAGLRCADFMLLLLAARQAGRWP
jgi:hypothetical protein